MPLLWCDEAEQINHNRCWRCAGYDWCETDAHREALRNFLLFVMPVEILIDVGILATVLKLAGVL